MLLKIFLLAVLTVHLNAVEKIVALSPAVNEIIFALDGGDKIVGNTTYCNFPQASQKIPKVGGYFSPSLEKILALNPDIVIMQDNNAAIGDKLQRLGIRTMLIKIDTIDSIKKAVFNIAKLLNNESKASLIVKKIDKSLASVAGITKNKKILIPIGYHTELSKEIYVAGQNLYFDDIIIASGNANALQSSQKSQPVLNLEKILKVNPDIVIILSPQMREKHLTKEALIAPWLKLPINAARTKSIFVEEGEYSGIPSDRIVHFIDDFGKFLRESNN